MALRSLPIRQHPRPGTDDDRHITYFCARCGWWYSGDHTCEAGDAR